MHVSRCLSSSLLCASLPFLVAAAPTTSQLLLPKPNGTYEVGVGTMELIDTSRIQPFAPTVQHPKLMVSCYYPVASDKSTTSMPYFPPETALFEDTFQSSNFGLNSPNGTFERLALPIAAQSSIPTKDHNPNFPVVMFSPAEGTSRLFYSAIASQVASTGYIVVTVDSPYDVDIVQYPDGSVAILNASVVATATLPDMILDVTTRAQDVSFVLDQLTNATVISHLIPGSTHGLSVDKVGMFGHSVGGATAATAMQNDTRIAGGVAMDGALFGSVVQTGLDRPFMLMAHTNHTRTNVSNPADAPIDPNNSWFDFWAKLTGWKLDIILADSAHYTFSDWPIVLETLGIVPNATVSNNLLVTNMNGNRALHIVTTYVTAFLDMVLKCEAPALLQGPVAAFPEVSFER